MHRVQEVMNQARFVRSVILAEAATATPDQLLYRPDGRWSVRDVLIHLATCEEQVVRVLGHFLNGDLPPRQEYLPPDEWNARELARCAHLDEKGALEFVLTTREALEKQVSRLTPAHLASDKPVLSHLMMTPEHEEGHLHQIREALAVSRGDARGGFLHGLAYARHQVLIQIRLEQVPAGALTFRPAAGDWSAKEMLLHLAVWDRQAALYFGALADDRPAPPFPFADGEMDAWNRQQVAARAGMSLAAALHELGAARAELNAAIARMTPDQFAGAEWRDFREHDLHHARTIRQRRVQWRAAQT